LFGLAARSFTRPSDWLCARLGMERIHLNTIAKPELGRRTTG
jgi:hypothetical protein